MMLHKKLILATAMFIIASCIGVYCHELAHIQVNEYFNRQHSSIEFNFKELYFYVTAEGECNDSCRLAHSNIDSEGYNNAMIALFIYVFALLYVAFGGKE